MPSEFVSGQILLTSRIVLFLLMVSGSSLTYSQHFICAQQDGNELVYLIGEGATIRVSYRGYSNQIQEIKGRIIGLTRDTIKLREEKLFRPDTFCVAVNDVLGIRHYTLARTISKSLLELGLVSGNIALYHLVLVPSALATGPVILIGIGTGLLSYGVIKVIYSDRVVRTKAEGWSFKVISRMPGTPSF